MKNTAIWTILIVALLVVLGIFYFVRQPAETENFQTGQQEPQVTTGQTEEPKPEPPTQQVKEINVIAKRWEFDPNPIVVNEGDLVRLKVRSIDVSHGIAIPDFGISERLNPGQEVTVEFTADKKGTFSFYCNVVCGAGHSSMRGQLIVN